MKLAALDLLENNDEENYYPDWKKTFYEFQDRLVEVDDTFEFVSMNQDVILGKNGGRDVNVIKIIFERPMPNSDKPMYTSTALVLMFRFDRLWVALYTSPENASKGRNPTFTKFADGVDDAIMYLNRMLN